jgi:hypothetical protein
MQDKSRFLTRKLEMLENCIRQRKARLASEDFEKDPELKYWCKKRTELLNEMEEVTMMYRNSNSEEGSNSRK